MFSKAKRTSNIFRRRAKSEDDGSDNPSSNLDVTLGVELKIQKVQSKKSGLSFNDDEDDGFEVKKGKQGVSLLKRKSSILQQVLTDSQKTNDTALPTSSWKSSTVGLYSAEGLAQLRKSQPFTIGATENVETRISHTDEVGNVRDQTNSECDRVVFTGDEAVFVDEYGEQGGSLDDVIDMNLTEQLKARDLKIPSMKKLKLTETDIDGLKDDDGFLAFDDSIPRFKSTSTLKEFFGSQKSIPDKADYDYDAQMQWEHDQAIRGAAIQSSSYKTVKAPSLSSELNVDGMQKLLNEAAQALLEEVKKGERQLSVFHMELATAQKAASEASEGAKASGLLFETFQHIREKLGDLCGMLREKEDMISQVEAARVKIASDAKRKTCYKYLEEQERKIVKFRQESPGAIESLGNYTVLPNGPLENFTASQVFKSNELDMAFRSKEIEEAEDHVSIQINTLLEAASLVLEDVDEDVRSLYLIKQLMEDWKRTYGEQYARAYCSISLPPILAPLVRLEILRWNPGSASVFGIPENQNIEVDTIFEHFEWFRVYFDFATDIPTPKVSDFTPDQDQDVDLIPKLIDSAALPFLAQLIEQSYNPLSQQQTLNFIAAVNEIFLFEPSSDGRSRLLEAPLEPMREAANAICVPIIGPVAASGAGLVMANECIQQAIALYVNISAWSSLVTPSNLIPIALSMIITPKIVPALVRLLKGEPPEGALVLVVETLEKIATAMPENWRRSNQYSDVSRTIMGVSKQAIEAITGLRTDKGKLKLQAAAVHESLRQL